MTRKSNLVFVPSAPRSTVIVGHTLVVEMEDGKDVRLLTHDIHNNTERLILISGVPRMEYNEYHQAHAAAGQTNVLHFEYSGYGDSYDSGIDNRNGYYTLDLVTKNLAFMSQDDSVECDPYRAFDKKYVFFTGRNSPIHGFKLVKSPLNDVRTENDDPKGKNLKTLTTFSVLRALTGSVYWLDQLSLCRHYAFVRLAEPITATKSGEPGCANSYYIVDVVSGKTRLLIKENVEKVTPGFISRIWWVGSDNANNP